MPFGLSSAQPVDQVQLGLPPVWTPAPTAQPDAAPAPTPQAPQAPPQNLGRPSMWDIAQGFLFDGQSPAEAAMAARQRAYQAQTLQKLPALLAGLPPGVQAAALMGGPKVWEELAKNWAPQTRSAGQQTDYMGGEGKQGGYTNSTDTYGVDDKSGLPFANGPGGGFRLLAPSLGGDFAAKDGIISSGRTGGIANRYETPQAVAPGYDLRAFLPGYGGAGGSGAVGTGGGGPEGPPAAPAANPQTGPRGIRNLNFGNVRALPHGQMWDGQTGTDGEGYAVFATPEAGAKAALTTLESYGKQGINTPMGIAARWAPAGDGKNDPVAYGHFLAGQLGVGPNDPVNLSDPKVQKQTLQGIFSFENGPGAMKAWRGAAPAGGRAVAGSSRSVAQGAQPHILTPAETAAAGFAEGTVAERAPDGTVSTKQQPQYGADWAKGTRQQFLESEHYKQLGAAQSALQALQHNIGQMTGPAAYTLLDTMARTINPGAVARQGTISAIEEMMGVPAHVVGSLQNIQGHGKIPLKTQQEILNAVTPFAQAHWDATKQLYDANVQLGAAHKVKPEDVTAPLGDRPQPMFVGPVPAPQARSQGIYQTPKGLMQWDGKLWHPLR